MEWRFVTTWTLLTALCWMLLHPIVKRALLEWSTVWALALVLVVVTVTSLRIAARLRRQQAPHWRELPTNLAWAIAAVFALLLTQPGAFAAVPQWALLRSRLFNRGWWLVASALGSLVSLLMAAAVIADSDTFYFAVEGLALGIAQWLVLRRQVAGAAWWIVISTVAYLAGGYGSSLMLHAIDDASLVAAHTLPNLGGGLVCGLITGSQLSRLTRAAHSG